MENLEEFSIPEDAIEKLKDPKIIRKNLIEGKTFQEILGYDNARMEKFYSKAAEFFERQEYEKAAEAFTFLTTLNPAVTSYWLGLGMSEQLIEEYHGALLAYAMAMMSDVVNPMPHYYTAMCYRSLMQPESAMASLQLAIRHCANNEGWQNLKQQALALQEKISEDKKKRSGY